MKRIIRILVLAIALVTGLTTVSAQTVQVLVIQKTPTLPTTVTSYLDDPFRYFNIQFILTGAGSDGLDIFFDMDFTVNTSLYYVRTKPNSVPTQPIHLSEGVNIIRKDALQTQLRNRMETNVDYNNPLKIQQLPEGTYELCVDVYLWSDRTNPARVPITTGPCPTFDICYSGSAPELVSPMAGAQMALNGAMVVTPSRRINFFWTPVISNCAGRNTKFKYSLKVVKVLDGQNYQDAIKYNPTAFSTEVRNNNYAVFDTLRDIKVQMRRGELYVAQVQAEQINEGNTMETFLIANEGKSQPMPFYWGGDIDVIGSGYGVDPINRRYGYVVDDESEEGEESEGVAGLTVWEGGVEEVSELDDILAEAFPDALAVTLYPKRHYVESDGYYTVPMADDLEVGFTPAQQKSLKDVSYALELYDFVDGGIDSITAYEPLFREDIEELPAGHDMVTRTLAGWGSELEQGSLYYLQLTCSYTASYWNYSIADTLFYVNEMLAEHVHDTITRDFEEETYESSNGVFFQWGDDPEAPEFKTPQWKAPVDRTRDDIYDPANYVLPSSVPEVQKAKTFPVSWTSVKNVTKGDEVEYEVNVYELKAGQTVEEAISENDVLVSRTLTDVNEITNEDSKFFKAFSSKKTYVMTLSTNVTGESETFYHFENGNEAIPVIFKVTK